MVGSSPDRRSGRGKKTSVPGALPMNLTEPLLGLAIEDKGAAAGATAAATGAAKKGQQTSTHDRIVLTMYVDQVLLWWWHVT